MKAVNVDDVLKILHKYGKYIFVTDEKKYSTMIDEIANLKALNQESILDKISSEVTSIAINGQVDEHTMFIRTGEQVKQMTLKIIDKYKAESEG